MVGKGDLDEKNEHARIASRAISPAIRFCMSYRPPSRPMSIACAFMFFAAYPHTMERHTPRVSDNIVDRLR